MIGVQLCAVDTLYFRDGTAYAASLTSPEHPGGQFPPHPATVVGAVRAWLARGNGWSGSRSWPRELNDVLGDGPDDLGRLRFDGPYLLRGGEPLFPVPAHLLGTVDDGSWTPTVAAKPGWPVTCDLGEAVRLPAFPATGGPRLEPGADHWLTRAGMAAVLKDGVPERGAVVRPGALWHAEPRVGIARDDDTRAVQEGMLYTSEQVRPRHDVAIGVRINGVPDRWLDGCGVTVPLGGEGRWAEYRPWDGDAACETPLPEILDRGTAMLVALTPIDAGNELPRVGGRIPGLGDATIVSACLPRMERVGGWATAASQRGPRHRRGPLPLRSVLPAGSTFFCEIGDPDGLRAAVERAAGAPRIGQRQRWGFGAVAIGVWKDTMEETT